MAVAHAPAAALVHDACERLLMKQIDCNFLFRWFAGLSIDAPVRDATVLIKNRDRLPKGETAEGLFAMVFTQARERRLLSDEHFAVDGTLIETWGRAEEFSQCSENRRDP
jgi:transposase